MDVLKILMIMGMLITSLGTGVHVLAMEDDRDNARAAGYESEEEVKQSMEAFEHEQERMIGRATDELKKLCVDPKARVEDIENVLRRGARVNRLFGVVDGTGRCSYVATPLHMAIRHHREDIVDILLAYNANVNSSYANCSALRLGICEAHESDTVENIGIIRKLLAKKVRIGYEELCKARDCSEAVRSALLNSDSEVRFLDHEFLDNNDNLRRPLWGKTGLWVARIIAKNGSFDSIKGMRIFLEEIIERDYADAVQTFIERLDSYISDGKLRDDGRTMLMHAAAYNSREVVSMLIARGVNLDERDSSGHSALMKAVGSARRTESRWSGGRETAIIEMLLVNGALPLSAEELVVCPEEGVALYERAQEKIVRELSSELMQEHAVGPRRRLLLPPVCSIVQEYADLRVCRAAQDEGDDKEADTDDEEELVPAAGYTLEEASAMMRNGLAERDRHDLNEEVKTFEALLKKRAIANREGVFMVTSQVIDEAVDLYQDSDTNTTDEVTSFVEFLDLLWPVDADHSDLPLEAEYAAASSSSSSARQDEGGSDSEQKDGQ